MNWELTDIQARFRKGWGTRNQIANIGWTIEKAREFQKTSTSASLIMLKPLTVWVTTNCGKHGNTRPPYLPPETPSCRQEATVRTRHGTTNWLQIGKGVHQGCILSPAYLNYMQSTSCEMLHWVEAQAGIKIAGRSINHLNTDGTTLWQKAKKNWRASWWKWKRRVKKLA